MPNPFSTLVRSSFLSAFAAVALNAQVTFQWVPNRTHGDSGWRTAGAHQIAVEKNANDGSEPVVSHDSEPRDTNSPITMPDAKFIGPFQVTGIPRDLYYRGEPAVGGVIDLIPEKAFFKFPYFRFSHNLPENNPTPRLLVKERDNGSYQESVAARQTKVEEAQKVLAKRGASQAELDALSDPGDSFHPLARWHLHCAQPGEITLSFFMEVTAEQAKNPWVVELVQGEQLEITSIARQQREARELTLVESDGSTPQPQTLTFQVKQPGRVSLYFDQTKMPRAEGAIRFIRCHGSAVEEASLLRARRRPSAFYFSFKIPEESKNPRTFICETKPIEGSPAFVPLTVSFGYTGRFFQDKFLAKDSNLHWSMWGSALGKDGTVDMTRAPRIIAQDNPESAVQISSKEGTTVRGSWEFYRDPAASLVQAFRTMTEPDGSVTHFGHLYDETDEAWRLYNAAQTSTGNAKRPPESDQAVLLPVRKTSSFVEIPGAYGRMMNGDVRHTFARRSYILDENGKFHPMPMPGSAPQQPAAPNEITEKNTRNMLAYPAPDYQTNGWVIIGTGGMAFFSDDQKTHDFDPSIPRTLPDYLHPDKAPGLEKSPVVFGQNRIAKVGPDHVTIEIEIKETGPNSKATLYFDTKDGTTHLADLDAIPKHKAFEKQLAALNPEEQKEFLKQGPHRLSTNAHRRAALATEANGWRNQTDEQEVKIGPNRFELRKLQPATTYFYRLKVTHDTGMSWTYTAGRFTTPPSR